MELAENTEAGTHAVPTVLRGSQPAQERGEVTDWPLVVGGLRDSGGSITLLEVFFFFFFFQMVVREVNYHENHDFLVATIPGFWRTPTRWKATAQEDADTVTGRS